MEATLDISGKCLDFSLMDDGDDDSLESVECLYLYKNEFNLVPTSVCGLRNLRNLKFFSNNINLFPQEFKNLSNLDNLQVKLSSPGFNGLSLHRLDKLKILELSKLPARQEILRVLTEICGLKCLTKLSLCYLSIRFVPVEIGGLVCLEFLDVSFNKIKRLPSEICGLSELVTLKVANNKLGELPSGFCLLKSLVNLDLSNNRLRSLSDVDFGLMCNLKNLNVMYNGIVSFGEIPSWVCCDSEGNVKDLYDDDGINCVVMDVCDGSSSSCNGSNSNESSTNGKRWKRQRARQEDENMNKKLKGEGDCKPVNGDAVDIETQIEGASDIVGLHDNDNDKQLLSVDGEGENSGCTVDDDKSSSQEEVVDESCCSSVVVETVSKECEERDHDASLAEQDEVSSSEISETISKLKRQYSDEDLDNPKPCKSQKPTDDSSNISRKYRDISFCGIQDRLTDGFYDAGRDRPFMDLKSYEHILHFELREVLLLDRKSDEELDAIVLSAQRFVFQWKGLTGSVKDGDEIPVNNQQIASLLALFVSDHFGGCDRSTIVLRTRKSVSGSNYQKPFVCTCSTGNSDSISTSSGQSLDTVEDVDFTAHCEKSLHSIKSRRNSIIVPIGTLRLGVCRHRALLLKYLCDRMEPPVPCELVRGYLDFQPHAWNTILVNRGDSWIRMIVDACHPLDIREEMDPEYFCRYVPLSRVEVPISVGSNLGPESFPPLSTCDEIQKTANSSLIRCKIGSVEAVAKIRTLEVCGNSKDEIRNFEYNCLGEVRILGTLKHSCIVEMYGHQLSSKWVPSADGNPERRILKSAILMEYVEGGSLKSYIEKLSKAGEKHVPVELALCIALDVASALAELHSKHIIHRDIKSENILFDLDKKKDDGTPIVKLCDFDRAVPLRSLLHTCCIAHKGIPPPDVCVGTPFWMAPEVLQALHGHNIYGLEVDIWSYGCLLFELLTLQVPHSGLSEFEFHDTLQIGKRPALSEELEALGSLNESAIEMEGTGTKLETLTFLVDLFWYCTEEEPTDRPTAKVLHEMLLAHTRKCTTSEDQMNRSSV